MTTKTRVAAVLAAGWRNRITGSSSEVPDLPLANPGLSSVAHLEVTHP